MKTFVHQDKYCVFLLIFKNAECNSKNRFSIVVQIVHFFLVIKRKINRSDVVFIVVN